jgi:hypothetical protein
MMPSVKLIYDASCPNVEAAREQLRRAFLELGQPPAWQECDRGAPSLLAHARHYGSPTILVDGKDVSGASHPDGADCCRVYRSEHGGLQKVPSVESITSALRNSAGSKGTGSLRSWLAILPAAGIAMLPKLACPACWPAYAGLLSSIGLGFLTDTTYLFPLTVGFLLVAVGTLGFRARNRHGFGPLATGRIAGLIVVVGKFYFESDPAMSGGIALLIAASVWNTWPKRRKKKSCPACVQAGHS